MAAAAAAHAAAAAAAAPPAAAFMPVAGSSQLCRYAADHEPRSEPAVAAAGAGESWLWSSTAASIKDALEGLADMMERKLSI
jgi:hypothetical protein